jgi:histone deacetylase 11
LSLTADKEYLSIFKKYLNESVDEVSPELIIYNAGSDILHGDSVGYLDVSLDGLRQRDEMVAQMCKNKNIPLAVVLSGGYKQEYFFEVSNSIANMAKILTPIH